MWTALLVPYALAAPAGAPASSTAPLPMAFEPAAGGGFVARAPGGAARISPGGTVIAAHGARPVRLRPAGGAPAALRRGLRVASGCSSACTISGKLVLVHRGTRTIARASAKGRAGRTVTLRLRVPARHLKALRRKGAVVRLLVTARSDGETATVRRKLSVRR